MTSGLTGVVKWCRPTIRQDIRASMKAAIARPALRRTVNAVYAALPWSEVGIFHDWFWDVFRGRDDAFAGGSWLVRFCGKRIRVPLRRESIGLDWAIATALLGHDVDVKQTYASLITGRRRPGLFVDVGSNFGTHSILFAANNIATLSLDPNGACNEYHRGLCAANGLTARIETLAVGERSVLVDFSFPPDEPWLGSTDEAIVKGLKDAHAVETSRVQQRTIDDWLPEFGDRGVLLKIDTEGNENRVLLGARQTLEKKSPPVIFECWPGARRREIYDLFAEFGYQIATLPWDGRTTARAISLAEFDAQRSINFVAIRR